MGDHAESLTEVQINNIHCSSLIYPANLIIQGVINMISSPCYADRSKTTSCLSYLKVILALLLNLLQSKLLFWFLSFDVCDALTNSCTSTIGDIPRTTNNLTALLNKLLIPARH